MSMPLTGEAPKADDPFITSLFEILKGLHRFKKNLLLLSSNVVVTEYPEKLKYFNSRKERNAEASYHL